MGYRSGNVGNVNKTTSESHAGTSNSARMRAQYAGRALLRFPEPLWERPALAIFSTLLDLSIYQRGV
jgi:hypothetical protein